MLGAEIAQALNLASANTNRMQLRSLFIFCCPFLLCIEIHVPTLFSTEKDEGGVPIRVGNAALQIRLKRRTPEILSSGGTAKSPYGNKNMKVRRVECTT